MFRLFLKKKLFSGTSEDAAEESKQKQEFNNRNRRIFERYNVDHKHLMLMNEQDIFLIKEISLKGFSTAVSERSYERLNLADTYEARIRYMGEMYDLSAKVAWKADLQIGFEITETNKDTLLFIKRLLDPVEIASSMKKIDSKFVNDTSTGKTWYHGDKNCDLYTWHNNENGELHAWQLSIGDVYIEWSGLAGIQTGTLSHPDKNELMMGNDLSGKESNSKDAEASDEKRQQATDIIMALQYPIREDILETIMG
jgi:hypothetical protein